MNVVNVTQGVNAGGGTAPLSIDDCNGDGDLDLFIRRSEPAYTPPVRFHFNPACDTVRRVEITFSSEFAATWVAFDNGLGIVDSEPTPPFLGGNQTVVLEDPDGIFRIEVYGAEICIDEICVNAPAAPHNRAIGDITAEPTDDGVEIIVGLVLILLDTSRPSKNLNADVALYAQGELVDVFEIDATKPEGVLTCAGECPPIFGDGECTACGCRYENSFRTTIPGDLSEGLEVRAVIRPARGGVAEIDLDDDASTVIYDPPDELCVPVFDLTHCRLGQATIDLTGDGLVLSNIGASGDDGVEIDLSGTTFFSGTIDEVKTGATLNLRQSGFVGGAEQVISQVQVERLENSFDFVLENLLGEGGHSVQVFDGKSYVGEVGVGSGAVGLTADVPQAAGAAAHFGPGGLKFEFVGHNKNPVCLSFAATTQISVGGESLHGDMVLVEPRSLQEDSSGFSDLAITAQGTPSFLIVDEGTTPPPVCIVFEGLAYRGQGDARIHIHNNQVMVSDIGASGGDGVHIETGEASLWEADLTAEALPDADPRLELIALGRSGNEGVPVSNLEIEALGEGLQATVQFDAPSYRMEIYSAGELVFVEPELQNGAVPMYWFDPCDAFPWVFACAHLTFKVGPFNQCEWGLSFDELVPIVLLPPGADGGGAGSDELQGDQIVLIENEEGHDHPEDVVVIGMQILGENLESLSIDNPNVEPFSQSPQFIRSDCNGDGGTDISDAIYNLAALFTGGDTPGCREACDANGDAENNLADAVFVFSFLFSNGQTPPAPYPECGADPDPDPDSSLGCEQPPSSCVEGGS